MGSACSMEWGRWEVGSGVLGSGECELIGELGVVCRERKVES